MARVGDLSQLSGIERLDEEEEEEEDLTRQARTCSPQSLVYWIQPVEALPRVNLTHTIVSQLFGRRTSAAERRKFHAWVVAFANRWQNRLYLVALIALPSTVAMFFVKDATAIATTATISFIAPLPLLTFSFATLSYDMTKLIVRTFEFWFLTAVNLLNTVVFFSLFRDIRVLGIITSSIFYQLTLFTDANLRTRLIELRFLVFGSPAMVVVVLACIFGVTPGLHYSSLSVLGTSVADVDLLLNGNFIIGFFTMRKTHRNRHLLSAKHKGERHIVQCQMYFPTCQLVVSDSPTIRRLRSKTAQELHAFTRRKTKVPGTEIAHEQTLHMIPSLVADSVDPDRLLLPMANCWPKRMEMRMAQWILNSFAIVGAVSTTLAHAAYTLRVDLPIISSTAGHLLAWEIAGLLGTIVTFVWYTSNCQRDLLVMLLNEVDAWFAIVHVTMVAICVADILHWQHGALPVLCAWVWSLWVVLLDAVPPALRRRLGFQRWYLLSVNFVLMLFHVSLLYALVVAHPSRAHPQGNKMFRNRVLVDATLGIFRLRLEMFSFVTSKIFTSFVWMSRFMWRECVRPRDAFKLIKRRVEFLIPPN